MGTYTTNKNLFMPTVGETGWGTLVNGNFETIDNFLKPITVSGSTYTFTGNHVGNQSGGTISTTSITNSGTLTQTGTSTFTGKITANGGIGTKALTTTSISNSGTLTQTGTSTFTGKITANGGIGTKALTATTGTFSDDVTAPNITKFGAIPYTWYLFGTALPDGYSYHYYGDKIGGSVQPNVYTSHTILGSTAVNTNSTLTVKSLYGMSNDIPILVTTIKKVGGSWSNPILKTNYENITATISGINGTITYSGLAITYAQAETLMRNQSTITIKNSNTGTGYHNVTVVICITNTSSSNQIAYKQTYGLYE